jgi:excisionase family DNA binding protein
VDSGTPSITEAEEAMQEGRTVQPKPPTIGNDRPLVLTVEEAAKLLRISRSLAYDMAKAGTLPTVRLGSRLIVPTERLLQMLAA